MATLILGLFLSNLPIVQRYCATQPVPRAGSWDRLGQAVNSHTYAPLPHQPNHEIAQEHTMANTVASSSTAPSNTPVDRVHPRRQQEQQLVVCGPMSLNGRRLLRKGSTRKRFDSGDWCLERLGLCDKDSMPFDVPVEKLSPKLCPEGASQALPRTRSFLRSTVAPSLVAGH